MEFEVKSLSDIVRTTENAFKVKFLGSGSGVLRKSVLKVLADVVGGSLYLMSLIAKHIWKNRFVSTCDDDCLDGFGAEYGLPHLTPLYAVGFVEVHLAEGSSSATLNSGTVLVDSQTGLEYEVVEDYAVAGDTLVNVVAVESGAKSNVDSGTLLSFRDGAPTGLDDSLVVVDGGIKGGYSVEVVVDGIVQVWGESASDYRARLLDRVQNPPTGCSIGDLVRWCRQFAFVTNVFKLEGVPKSNSVILGVANLNPGSGVSLTNSQIEEVRRYVTNDVRRMVCADIRVVNAVQASFTVNASVAPFTASARDSAEAAIVAFMRQMVLGRSYSFDELNVYVRSNSAVSNFTVYSVKKGSQTVSALSIGYRVPQTGVDNAYVEAPVVTVNWSAAS